MGAAVCVRGARGGGEISVLSAQVCYELKTALKSEVKKKKRKKEKKNLLLVSGSQP